MTKKELRRRLAVLKLDNYTATIMLGFSHPVKIYAKSDKVSKKTEMALYALEAWEELGKLQVEIEKRKKEIDGLTKQVRNELSIKQSLRRDAKKSKKDKIFLDT